MRKLMTEIPNRSTRPRRSPDARIHVGDAIVYVEYANGCDLVIPRHLPAAQELLDRIQINKYT